MEYRFLQYPRGLNKGGYSIPMYARLSVAHRGKTIVSWLRYVQANKRCLDEHSTYSWGGDVQGPIRQSWILRHSIQHHYKSWQFTSLRNSRRMDKVKNNRGGRVIEVWSSLQAHRGVNREGICPTIGTTDFSLPRIVIEYEDNEF